MLNVGQQLGDSDHVVRYVPPSRLARDEDDKVVGFLFSAFQMREGEPSLSTSRLEHFSGDRSEKITKCIQVNRECLVVRPTSAFAIGNVGNLKAVGQRQVSGRAIKVVYSPTGCNPAHTSVEKLPREEMELLEQLATEVFSEIVLNSQVP